jgi:membrane protease YdiL (CAAX protease family)
MVVPVLYLLALTIAEIITTFVSAQAGLLTHAGILSIILIDAAFWADDERQRFLLALSLAPMVRILSLALPLQHVRLMYWYAIDAIPWVTSAAVVALMLGLRRRNLGLGPGSLRLQLAIASTGIGLGLLEYAILRPQPLITRFTWSAFWVPALILLLGTGFTEEFIFRGVMLGAFSKLLGRFAILYVSIVFAVLHIGYKSATDLLFVFAVGLFYTWVVARTGSILGVTFSHGIANTLLYVVVPFLSLGSLHAVAPHAGSVAARLQPPARTAHTGPEGTAATPVTPSSLVWQQPTIPEPELLPPGLQP